jgi:hypothetical protein
MNRPRTTDVLGAALNLVRTTSGPGKREETMPAAQTPPRICAIMTTTALAHPIAPMSANPRLTCKYRV